MVKIPALRKQFVADSGGRNSIASCLLASEQRVDAGNVLSHQWKNHSSSLTSKSFCASFTSYFGSSSAKKPEDNGKDSCPPPASPANNDVIVYEEVNSLLLQFSGSGNKDDKKHDDDTNTTTSAKDGSANDAGFVKRQKVEGQTEIDALLVSFSSESVQTKNVKEAEVSHGPIDKKQLSQRPKWIECRSCNKEVLSRTFPEDSLLHYLFCAPIKFVHQALLALLQILVAFLVFFVANPLNFEVCTRYQSTLFVAVSITTILLYVERKSMPSNGELEHLFKNIVHSCPNCGNTLDTYRFFWDSMVGTLHAEGNVSGGVEVKTRSDLNIKANTQSAHSFLHQVNTGIDISELSAKLGVNVAPIRGNLDVNVSPIDVNANARTNDVKVKHSFCTIM